VAILVVVEMVRSYCAAEKFEAVDSAVVAMAVVAGQLAVVVPEAMAEVVVELFVAEVLLAVESEAVVEFSAVVVVEEVVAVSEPVAVVLQLHFSWQDQVWLEDHPFLCRPSDQV